MKINKSFRHFINYFMFIVAVVYLKKKKFLDCIYYILYMLLNELFLIKYSTGKSIFIKGYSFTISNIRKLIVLFDNIYI